MLAYHHIIRFLLEVYDSVWDRIKNDTNCTVEDDRVLSDIEAWFA